MERFIVWTVNMTVWSLTLQCFALLEQDGPCHIDVPVIVYSEFLILSFWRFKKSFIVFLCGFTCRCVSTEPPDNVSISLVNHTGAMLEDRRYTLQCSVEGVAPVENLTVTFYRGQKALGRLQSCSSRSKEPVTEIFALNFTTSSEDDGAEFWCEAELDLGPEGPHPPPVVKSQHITAAVHCEWHCSRFHL